MELKIKRATKSVELCLDLSLRGEWERYEAELKAARQDPTVDQRLAGGPVTTLAKKVRELEEAMEASTIIFTLEALPHREWEQVKQEHPPREGDKGDEKLGFNESTIFDDVIPRMVRKVEGPDGDEIEWSRDTWTELADDMTNGQYEDFKVAAWVLSLGAAARLPKSLTASLAMRDTDEN